MKIVQSGRDYCMPSLPKESQLLHEAVMWCPAGVSLTATPRHAAGGGRIVVICGFDNTRRNRGSDEGTVRPLTCSR